MTNEEIEKALKICGGNSGDICNNCPYTTLFKCGDNLCEDALDYINRLKDQLYQSEQKLAECENGYEGTLFLERCKYKDELEQVRQDTAKEILQTIQIVYMRDVGSTDIEDTFFYDELIKIAAKYGVEIDE